MISATCSSVPWWRCSPPIEPAVACSCRRSGTGGATAASTSLPRAATSRCGNLHRDPRATILVYEHTPPYRGIELRTEPTLLRDGARETAREIAVRYLGREAGEAYASGGSNEIVIRLEPGELRAWDFADES
jgi:hypothetical protein